MWVEMKSSIESLGIEFTPNGLQKVSITQFLFITSFAIPGFYCMGRMSLADRKVISITVIAIIVADN